MDTDQVAVGYCLAEMIVEEERLKTELKALSDSTRIAEISVKLTEAHMKIKKLREELAQRCMIKEPTLSEAMNG